MMSDDIFVRDLLLRINDATKDISLSEQVEKVYLDLSGGKEVESTVLSQVTMDVQTALQNDVENTARIERLRQILYGLSDKLKIRQ